MLEFLVANIAPLAIGLLTVQIMGGIKWIVDAIDGWPAGAQRLAVGFIAVGLTQAAAALNVALPTDLILVTADNLEAIMAALIAMGAHAFDRNAGST